MKATPCQHQLVEAARDDGISKGIKKLELGLAFLGMGIRLVVPEWGAPKTWAAILQIMETNNNGGRRNVH